MSGATEFMAPILQDQTYRQNEATLPAELAQKAASTRYTAALADRVETESAGEKKVAAQLAQAAGVPAQAGGNGSISEQLSGMSSMYAKAGLPNKAAEYAEKASQAAAHEATARAAIVREAAAKTKLQGEQFKQASTLLSEVTDQASWEQANALFAQQTGQDSPFKAIPYDPKIVKMLQDVSMNAYQKQMVQLRATAVGAQVANIKSSIESRGVRDGVALERLRVTQQREGRLAKAGGKDIGAPGKPEVAAADKLIGDTGLEGDERDAAAFSIASDAKVLRRKNPGLSADEALRQAALTAKTNGSISPGAQHLLSRNEPAKFSPPQPLPAHGDPSKLVKGQRYADGKGNVATWDGKGWTAKGKVGGSPAAKAAPAAGPDDGEDPEGDDNE